MSVNLFLKGIRIIFYGSASNVHWHCVISSICQFYLSYLFYLCIRRNPFHVHRIFWLGPALKKPELLRHICWFSMFRLCVPYHTYWHQWMDSHLKEFASRIWYLLSGIDLTTKSICFLIPCPIFCHLTWTTALWIGNKAIDYNWPFLPLRTSQIA